MKNKRKLLLIMTLNFICIFAGTVGITIAYLKAQERYKETSVYIQPVDLILSYNDNNIIAEDIYPGWSKSITFSLKNVSKSDITGAYKINLEVLTPFTENKESVFVYSLVKESSLQNNLDERLISVPDNTPVPITTSTLGVGRIKAESEHTYTLSLLFKGNKEENFEYQNKRFVGKIEVIATTIMDR